MTFRSLTSSRAVALRAVVANTVVLRLVLLLLVITVTSTVVLDVPGRVM